MMPARKLVSRLVAQNSVHKSFARSLGSSVPPRVRISRVEQAAHDTVFTVAILAIPAYICVNIKNYRGN